METFPPPAVTVFSSTVLKAVLEVYRNIEGAIKIELRKIVRVVL